MDRILVAYDGSKAAVNALKWSVKEAAMFGQGISILTCYEVPSSVYAGGLALPANFTDTMAEGAQKLGAEAEQLVDELKEKISHEVIIKRGNVVENILEESVKEDISKIVMGSRGRNAVSSVMLGSSSVAVVSHSSKPVVVLREDHGLADLADNAPVVVGFDGEENSLPAFKAAIAEAEARQVNLLVLHSWLDPQIESVQIYLGTQYLGLSKEEIDKHKSNLESVLQPIIKNYPTVKIEMRFMQDNPALSLCEAAKQAQLVVVGSRGRGGFKGMLLGSTSQKLLHDAPVPLMVVRP